MTYIIVGLLVTFSGLFSGLTLGLMGLNTQELKRKKSLGDANARKIYTIRKRGNLLLTTLLVGNVAVNSALAIFLGSLATGIVAGLLSTGLIVILGEIIPQAVFSRFALQFGSKFVWLVRIIIWVLLPVTWPIAWVLNRFLGEELPAIYSKRELIKIIEEHEDSPASDLKEDEERIVKGALTFRYKVVEDVMTPQIAAVSFSVDEVIDKNFIQSVANSGLSRFPVYDGNDDNVVAILYMKDLLGKRNFGKTVGSIAKNQVQFVSENDTLGTVFDSFLKTRQHLFMVSNEFGDIMGLVTMEDILEEIIQAEIMDEGDKHQDMRKVARELAKKRRSVKETKET